MIHRIALAIIVAVAALGAAHAGLSAKKPQRIDDWSLPGHGGFAFGFGSAWIAGGGTLLRVSPSTGRIVSKVELPRGGGSPVVVGDSIWLSNGTGLDEFDPTTKKVVAHVPVRDAGILAFGFGSLWTVTQNGDVIRVDPKTKTVVATVPVQQGPADWAPILAAGEHAIWVASADTHSVVKINPGTNAVVSRTPVGTADSLLTVAAAYGSVWVHENAGADGRGMLYRLNPSTAAVVRSMKTSSPLGGQYGGTDVAVAENSVWVANANGTVSRVAANGSRIQSSRHLVPLTEWLAVADGYVWFQSDNGDASRVPIRRFSD